MKQSKKKSKRSLIVSRDQLLPLTSDLVFKAVYGRDAPDSKEVLIAMLNIILNRRENPIKEIEIKNPFVYDEQPKNKLIVMDIKARLDTEEWVDIEMQVGGLGSYINRTLFYMSKLIGEQLESGEMYGSIEKTIVISIVCGGRLFLQTGRAHNVFRYKEVEEGFELTDRSDLHFLELDKIDTGKEVADMTAVERLGAYLRYAADPGRAEYVRRLLASGEEVIAMSEEILKKVSRDDQMREWQKARDRFLMDEKNRMWEAEQRGLKAGLEQGETNALLRVSELMQRLFKDGRESDLKRMAEDLEYQKQLMEEYNI